MTYREKRRSRNRSGRAVAHRQQTIRGQGESAGLISLGTIASLAPKIVQRPELSVVIAGHYEVRVGNGFQPAALARLVRTLEQLA